MIMNDLQIFNNPEFGEIRAVEIDGEPWFVGKDVAAGLGYKDTVNALKSHVDTDDKRGWQITTPSGEQEMTIINESGVYSLIFSSKLESAKKFKRWVTAEVLPAIRKTGAYIAPQAQPPATLDAAALQTFSAAIDTLTATVQTLVQRMDAQDQRPRLPAVSVKPPENKFRRQWMRTASEKLNTLAEKCGLPSSTVLHYLYQDLEERFKVSLSEVRLKALEEHQLTDCSVLLAIFYDKPLRDHFMTLVDDYIIDQNLFW